MVLEPQFSPPMLLAYIWSLRSSGMMVTWAQGTGSGCVCSCSDRLLTEPDSRKFWRENLPRLKFWNPSVPMIINRVQDQSGPAKMTLYFLENGRATPTSPNASELSSSSQGHAKAPTPAENERVVVIDMKHQRSDAILSEFLKKTGGVPVIPTPQEEAELRDAEALSQRGDGDRVRVKKVLDAQRREARLLSQARTEAAAMKAAA